MALSDLPLAVLRAMCLCLVGLLLIASVTALARDGHFAWAFAGLVLTVMIVVAAVHTDRRDRLAIGVGIFLLITFATQTFLWALMFDSQQGSDFGVYYRCGINLRATLDANLHACQSAYIAYGDLYWRRSLLSTVPIGWAGGGYLALKLTNAMAQTITGLVLWVFMWRTAGAWAASITLLIFASYPDRSFALTLATSDHVALLLTVLGLLSLKMLDGRADAVLIGCFGAGVISVALDLTRSTGIFLAATALVVLIVRLLPIRGIRSAALGLAGLVAGVVAARLLIAGAVDPSSRGDGFLRLASSLYITGVSDATNHWGLHFWPVIPLSEQTRVAIYRIVQEVIWHGAALPAYVIEKARFLTAGTGYALFSSIDMSTNHDTVFTVERSTVPGLFFREPALARASVLPALGLMFVGTLRARATALNIGAMAFFSVAIGEILLLGEVQPRYLLIVLPSLALLGGMTSSQATDGGWHIGVRQLEWGAAAIASGACLCVFAWLEVKAATQPILSDISAVADRDCSTLPEQVVADDRGVTLHLPIGVSCAKAQMTVPAHSRGISLFITDGRFPYRFEHIPATFVDYKILTASSLIEGTLDAHVVWRHIDLQMADKPQRILVTLSRPSSDTDHPASVAFAYPILDRNAH